MTIPSAKNIALKGSKFKYRELMWQMKTEVIPAVVGRDPKDLHAEICTNPREGGLVYEQND